MGSCTPRLLVYAPLARLRGPRLGALGIRHPVPVRGLAGQVFFRNDADRDRCVARVGVKRRLTTSRGAAGSLARHRICSGILFVHDPRRMELRAPRPGWGSYRNLLNLATSPILDGTPVAARQGHLLATAFHPELTRDDRFHRFFLRRIGQQV